MSSVEAHCICNLLPFSLFVMDRMAGGFGADPQELRGWTEKVIKALKSTGADTDLLLRFISSTIKGCTVMHTKQFFLRYAWSVGSLWVDLVGFFLWYHAMANFTALIAIFLCSLLWYRYMQYKFSNILDMYSRDFFSFDHECLKIQVF